MRSRVGMTTLISRALMRRASPVWSSISTYGSRSDVPVEPRARRGVAREALPLGERAWRARRRSRACALAGEGEVAQDGEVAEHVARDGRVERDDRQAVHQRLDVREAESFMLRREREDVGGAVVVADRLVRHGAHEHVVAEQLAGECAHRARVGTVGAEEAEEGTRRGERGHLADEVVHPLVRSCRASPPRG